MQNPTSADEPKTKEACGKMIASFITEHNIIESTREQQIMAWKTLNWNSAQERLDDFVYKLRRIGQELGKTEDEQLEYFKCSVPPHLYLYHKDATTIKEAMENIKRACALGGVSVQATPVEPRTTQSVPFMQMAERTDSKIVARKDDHIEVTALKFNGMLDSIEKEKDRLTKSVARTTEIQGRKLDRDRDSNVVLLLCGCLSLNPFIEFGIWNNSSSPDVLNVQASISISPKYVSKSKTTSHCHLLLHAV